MSQLDDDYAEMVEEMFEDVEPDSKEYSKLEYYLGQAVATYGKESLVQDYLKRKNPKTVAEAAEVLNQQILRIYKPGTFSVGHTVGLDPEEIVINAHKRVQKIFKNFLGIESPVGEFKGYKVTWKFMGKVEAIA